MKANFETHSGVCCKFITVDFDEETSIINEVKFYGGCPGNTKAVAALVKGCKMDHVIERLKDVDCGGRGTSCSSQLAEGLIQLKDQVSPLL